MALKNLMIILFVLPLFKLGVAFGQIQNLPPCYLDGPGGQTGNISLAVGTMCTDGTKALVLHKSCTAADDRRVLSFRRCLRAATKKELAAKFGGSGTASVAVSENTSTTPATSTTATIPGSTTTTTTTTANPEVILEVDPGSTTRTTTTTSTPTRVKIKIDGREAALLELDGLTGACSGFEDYAIERERRKEEIIEELKRYKCSGPDCINLEKLQRDMEAALAGCHSQCVDIALKSDGVCHYSKLKTQFPTTEHFCETLMASDGTTDNQVSINQFKADPAFSAGQSKCAEYIQKNTDAGKLCRKLAEDGACAAIMMSSSFSCTAGREKMLAYFEAKRAYDDLAVALAELNAPLKKASCRVTCAKDARSAWSNREKHSIACLYELQSSCNDALAKAQIVYDNAPCVDCQTRGGGASANADGGMCLYGPCRGGGVSKAAQIISAAGGIAVPIGLGLMGMSMYNRNLNACVAAYQLQVQQATVVGLPPQASQCGVGGFGMGGFGGGIGMMNPMMMGMNGMMNPMMMGMNGMMNPMMMGMNGMMNPMMGMNGMMNPMMGMGGGLGFGIGLNGGMGMGMGMPGMMPGMGMGMGMGMPGMMPGMGMGMGMGMPGMMPGMGMGMGMPGMMGGGMGTFNPYAIQNGFMGVQQQMMDSQMRMQELALQNMILQQSGGMGFGMGGQFGMGYPMMNMGMYNPYMMGAGMGMGSGLNFNAGVNLNVGLPSINPYMYMGGGMSPYGFGNMANSCGYYQGIPCQ